MKGILCSPFLHYARGGMMACEVVDKLDRYACVINSYWCMGILAGLF